MKVGFEAINIYFGDEEAPVGGDGNVIYPGEALLLKELHFQPARIFGDTIELVFIQQLVIREKRYADKGFR